MPETPWPQVAIVDYGMGNLFSVKHACEAVGLKAALVSSAQDIFSAVGVILPGVGAFGDAMEALARLDLVSVLLDIAASEKPLVGICLGMQLLMTGSHEFGWHRGLGIIEGEVVRLEPPVSCGGTRLKVPQVGWNRIYEISNGSWKDSFLEGLKDGEFMYFVHSFCVKPGDSSLLLSTTRFGDIEFCSSLRRGNVFACQFHPERSGLHGLCIYRNLAARIAQSTAEAHHA